MERALSRNLSIRPGQRIRKKDRVPLRKLALVASIAAGVQFGWALQLSLLTPYVQELGIPHAWASLIWLCGPISGMIVQPIVGHYSDNCTSKYGRRRPFIVFGALLVVIAVLIIGFSADLGHLFGDDVEKKPHIGAIVVFIIGFWFLDLANNTLQGPCRALLADFTGRDLKRTRRANSFFSGFMAVGNILGFATGAYEGWDKVFPFTKTRACETACANLKSAFLLDIIMLVVFTAISITAVAEKQWIPEEEQLPTSTTPLLGEKKKEDAVNGSQTYVAPADPATAAAAEGAALPAPPPVGLDIPTGRPAGVTVDVPSGADGGRAAGNEEEEEEEEEEESGEEDTKWVLWELFAAMKTLPRAMWFVLLVTGLTWLSWFPFLLYDTDWFGREVFRGDTGANSGAYYTGVHYGSLGLMLNSAVLGLTSLAIEPACRRFGSRNVWAYSNIVITVCFLGMWLVSHLSYAAYQSFGAHPGFFPSWGVRGLALAIFALLGIPLAVTYSLPYSMTAIFTSDLGGGQGLSMGVLNLAVVLPQIIVSVGSGPWDELFGGGNVPAFVAAAVLAGLGGIAALLTLPNPPPGLPPPGAKLRRTMSSPMP